MSDLSDSSDASLRLSNAERDRAVAALQSHAGDGRLTEAEVQARVQSARTAVSRGDLAPLFADLPGFVEFDHAASPGAPLGATQPGSDPSYSASGAFGPADGYGSRDGYGVPGRGTAGRPFGPNGYVLVSVAPFISVILFFLTSWIWGFAYSWLWFLIIPIAGVIVYGGGYEARSRDRHRDRDRDRYRYR